MRRESLSVVGLSAAATIDIDQWGVAHIKASNRADGFLVQGFNAARDRLWQIDLWRKRGLGLLAADFGPGYLEQDLASRLFLYRGDMAAEWAAYDGDAEATCIAFVAGINAYIDLVSEEPERLPVEFVQMHTRPEKWLPEDVVRIRSHALSRNALSEVLRANVMARSTGATDLLRQDLDPPVTSTASDGVDLSAIPLECLDLFKLASAAVSFEPERLAASLQEAPQWRKLSALGEVERAAQEQGSNNWAISPARTATGRAILANDPHRALALPSLRYVVHVSVPGLDVIGAGEPILPGISIGHNGRIAFGLTIFPGPDQEDVYVYDTAPDQPNRYRFRDAWEEMLTSSEVLEVKGHPDQHRVLYFTRHGPIVFKDLEANRAIAVRSVWFEPGSAPYFASVAAMDAQNFDDFRDRMKRWAVPTVNQVYADIDGNIGWIAAARYPVRNNWDGLLPVPGDGRFEWDQFKTSEQLPYILNPSSGFCASANEMNVPQAWSAVNPTIGYEWMEPSRARRIEGRLEANDRSSVSASCRLQTDVTSLVAQRVCNLLMSERASTADRMLRNWNGDLGEESAKAALFEVWWSRHLRPGLLKLLSEDAAVRLMMGPGDTGGILNLLERPDGRLGEEPERVRDALLAVTLADAFEDCVSLMGADPELWAWGGIHLAQFSHPLSRLAMPEPETRDVGPFPQGGSSSTPLNGSYNPANLRVTVGASVRLVLDVGGWDNSLWINAPGQSGDPRSPHYADLASLWATGRYLPLLYSAAAIEPHIEVRIGLLPEK